MKEIDHNNPIEAIMNCTANSLGFKIHFDVNTCPVCSGIIALNEDLMIDDIVRCWGCKTRFKLALVQHYDKDPAIIEEK